MDKKEIYEAVMSGSKTKKEVADELGINYTEVCRILRDENLDEVTQKTIDAFTKELHHLLSLNIKAHIYVTVDLTPPEEYSDEKPMLYVNIRMRQVPVMNFKWRENDIMTKINEGLTPFDLSLSILETYDRYIRNIFYKH